MCEVGEQNPAYSKSSVFVGNYYKDGDSLYAQGGSGSKLHKSAMRPKLDTEIILKILTPIGQNL